MKTFNEFVAVYGSPDKPHPVIEVGPEAADWPSVVVKFGDYTAIVQFMGVGADGDSPHLCIDVHPFVNGQAARASVFGMEVGRRVEAFRAGDTTGTSLGLPATPFVAVLIGEQTS